MELPDHRLTAAMSLAAFVSLRSPGSKGLYDGNRPKGKGHNAAIICLAARRCNAILAASRRPPREMADAA